MQRYQLSLTKILVLMVFSCSVSDYRRSSLSPSPAAGYNLAGEQGVIRIASRPDKGHNVGKKGKNLSVSQSIVANFSELHGFAFAISRMGVPEGEFAISVSTTEPGAAPLATTSYSFDSEPLSTEISAPSWIEIILDTPLAVTLGTKLLISIRAQSGDKKNYFKFVLENDAYSDGEFSAKRKYDLLMRLYVSGEGELPEENESPPPVDTIPDLIQREGFGSDTPGGKGGDIFWVESLADDGGSNTLRAGLSRGERVIKFRIGGQIKLNQALVIRESYLTIDGLSAPTPVTITGNGLIVRGAHDIIIQGIRLRNTIKDGISIQYNSHHILIQQVSIHGSGDGNLDITAFKAGSTVHDITVAWSILARPAGSGKNVLIKYNNPHRISLHHNLFISARQRNPQMRSDAPSGDVNLDFRNNVIWQWPGGYGTLIYGAKANVVGNYYASDDRSDSTLLVNNGAEVFAIDNVSGDGVDIDVRGNKSSPFPSAPVTTTSVCDAAAAVLESSGVQPRDDIDQGYVDTVELPLCP